LIEFATIDRAGVNVEKFCVLNLVTQMEFWRGNPKLLSHARHRHRHSGTPD
jgi:hypothetical protein